MTSSLSSSRHAPSSPTAHGITRLLRLSNDVYSCTLPCAYDELRRKDSSRTSRPKWYSRCSVSFGVATCGARVFRSTSTDPGFGICRSSLSGSALNLQTGTESIMSHYFTHGACILHHFVFYISNKVFFIVFIYALFLVRADNIKAENALCYRAQPCATVTVGRWMRWVNAE